MNGWKQPIPTQIPEMTSFMETIFQKVLIKSKNEPGYVYLKDNTSVWLERGQCIFGRFSWNEMFGLPAGSKKIEGQIAKMDRWMDRRIEAKYSVITVKNYDDWVSMDRSLDNNRTTTGQHVDTNKNDKNVKNDKNINININGRDHGNELVNFCITEFKRHYGFEPTDKYPRKVAWNLIQKISTILKKRGDEINDDYLKEKIGVYMNWYAAHESYQNTEKLETVKLKLSKFVSG